MGGYKPTMKGLTVALQIADALLDAVEATGDKGAPSGYLYAACMGTLSLNNFTHFMRLLEEAGRVRKVGQVYYSTKPQRGIHEDT